MTDQNLLETKAAFGSPEPGNADLVRKAHTAFKTGDMDLVREVFAEDIVWHVTGSSLVSGTARGMDEVMANFGKVMELTNGTYSAIGFDYLGGTDHACALARVHAERNGQTLDIDELVVFDVVDGKLGECWHIAYDQEAWDTFFS